MIRVQRARRAIGWRRPAGLAAPLMFLLACAVLADEYRYWSTAEGQRSRVKLRVVERADRLVKLQRQDDGRVVELAVDRLSDEDRTYLRTLDRPRERERAAGGDWPRFRGPFGTGVSDETGLPLTWSATRNIVWKTPLPGPGASSPVVFGDRVYLTCYSGYGLTRESPGDPAQLERHLLCLRRSDGEILWSDTVESAVRESDYTGGVANHGFATSTPVVDADGVYVLFGASGAAAYDHDGRRRWLESCGTNVCDYGSAASPILVDDLLIINAGVEARNGNAFGDPGALIALDKNTGQERWSAEDIFGGYMTPALIESDGMRQLVLGKRGGVLAAHAVRDGSRLWQCNVSVYAPTPTVHRDVLYILSKQGYAAVRAGGSGDVTSTHKLWDINQPTYRLASPIYWQGHLYWASMTGGIVNCIRTETGETVYRERLRPAAGEIYASPILAEDRIYYVSRQHGTFVLAAEPELRILAHNSIDTDPSVFSGSPAISDGRLFLRSNAFAYCIGQDAP